MTKYRIVQFDLRAAVPRLLLALTVAVFLTWLNPYTAVPEWVKMGENFVLNFPLVVGILLYGFATGVVFATGQSAWSRAVEVARQGEVKRIEELLNEKPDQFPTFLMFIGWFILVICSLFIQIPREMLFIMFFLHFTLLLPLILAMDYWGLTDGIKKIERIR